MRLADLPRNKNGIPVMPAPPGYRRRTSRRQSAREALDRRTAEPAKSRGKLPGRPRGSHPFRRPR
jgi:hypothetical protein